MTFIITFVNRFFVKVVICNFEIERGFKMIDDNDLDENFVGVFPSNKMNKFFDEQK